MGKIKTILILLLLISGLASPPAMCEDTFRTGRVMDISGDVSIKVKGGNFVPASLGMEFTQGDFIKTGMDSSALLFVEGIETSQVEVYENSLLLMRELVMDREKGSQSTLLDLALGKILVKSKKIENKGSKFEVKTPTTVVGAMGDMDSSFSVQVEALD